MEKLTVWKDRANTAYITLLKKTTPLTSQEMASITGVGILYDKVEYKSVDYPEYFDFTTYASTSQIALKLGLTPMPVGNDVAELILYDADSLEGYVWKQIAIRVIDDAVI